MPTVVEQRQKPGVQTGQRSDTQDDRQHQERAGPKGPHPQLRTTDHRRFQQSGRVSQEQNQIESDKKPERPIIPKLVRIPENRPIADAHPILHIRGSPELLKLGTGVVSAGSVGRRRSAARNPAIRTRVRTGHIRRWASRRSICISLIHAALVRASRARPSAPRPTARAPPRRGSQRDGTDSCRARCDRPGRLPTAEMRLRPARRPKYRIEPARSDSPPSRSRFLTHLALAPPQVHVTQT